VYANLICFFAVFIMKTAMDFFKKFIFSCSFGTANGRKCVKINILCFKISCKQRFNQKTVRNKINKLAEEKRLQLNKSRAKIKVVFLIRQKAHWACQSVYDAMAEDGSFEVEIWVLPDLSPWVLPELRERNMCETYDFFKKLGMKVKKGYDFSTGTLIDVYKENPDILIYQTHWSEQSLPEFNVMKLYDRFLCVDIAYGYYLAAIQCDQFNHLLHNFAWKSFAQTPFHKELSVKYADNRGINVVAAGYPKMDALYSGKVFSYPWKTSSEEIKRIIWAPHYSLHISKTVKSCCAIDLATFDRYYKQMYAFVKSHPGIEMIMKPHPHLGSRIMELGLMSGNEWENYVKSWKELPNGGFDDGGNYMDIFKGADAMILDSISYIAEFMQTGNPMCFTSKYADRVNDLAPRFNEFGKMTLDKMYIADDWKAIENFISEVVIKGCDGLKENRERFVEEYLQFNKGHAGKFISDHIKGALIS